MKKVLSLALTMILALGSVCAAAEDEGRFDFFRMFNSNEVIISQEEYDQLKRFSKLAEVYAQIQQYYYEEPDEEKMMEGALWGMLEGLGDNYTFYYPPESWKSLWEDDEGNYAGVGIQMLANYNTNVVTISRVFKNTPAEQAGIRKGDILVRVDDLQVTAENMTEAANLMRGKEADTVELEIIRKGENIVYTVGRAIINVNWTEMTMLEDNVGLIALYEFSGDCEEKLSADVEELEKQGATALILDLRDNTGGWVDAAEKIANIFLDKQLLFYSENRAGNREERYTKAGKDDIPLVVLVNGASASSSEILSGSLQDCGRALVVGTQTYGKGIMQYVLPLSGVEGKEDGMQVTYAQYFMPSGRKVHKIGITPDVISEMPEELVGNFFQLGDMDDPQLKTAWEQAVKLRNGEIELKPHEPVTEEETESVSDLDTAAWAPEPYYISLPF